MKKLMIFAMGALTSWISMNAITSQDIEQAKKEAQEVTYTITIYRDADYNKERWNEIIEDTAKVIQKAQAAQIVK